MIKGLRVLTIYTVQLSVLTHKTKVDILEVLTVTRNHVPKDDTKRGLFSILKHKVRHKEQPLFPINPLHLLLILPKMILPKILLFTVYVLMINKNVS